MPKGSSKGYSSVRFIAPNAPLGADETPTFVEANRMINQAVAAQMEKNGLKVVAGNADLIVAHLIILQDNTSTSYSNQYYGLQEFSDIVTLAHKEGMKKHYPENVQKRALVIDLIDAKTYSLSQLCLERNIGKSFRAGASGTDRYGGCPDPAAIFPISHPFNNGRSPA
jgi:hypothetical protein